MYWVGPPSRSLSRFPGSMKGLGVLLLPPRKDNNPSQVYPSAFQQASLKIHWYSFIRLGGEKHWESKVSCMVPGENGSPWASFFFNEQTHTAIIKRVSKSCSVAMVTLFVIKHGNTLRNNWTFFWRHLYRVTPEKVL